VTTIESLFRDLANLECNVVRIVFRPQGRLRFSVTATDTDITRNGETLEAALGKLLDALALDRVNDELIHRGLEIEMLDSGATLYRWSESGRQRIGTYPSWQEAARRAKQYKDDTD